MAEEETAESRVAHSPLSLIMTEEPTGHKFNAAASPIDTLFCPFEGTIDRGERDKSPHQERNTSHFDTKENPFRGEKMEKDEVPDTF